MRVLIIGYGNAGRRHAAIFGKHFEHDIYLLRSDTVHPAFPRGAAAVYPELTSWRQVEDIDPSIAIISNPTPLHMETAIECASRGMHLFIEKPLRAFGQCAEVKHLMRICASKHLSTYVAYPFRHHPTVGLLRSARLCEHQLVVECFTNFKKWPARAYGDESVGDGILLELSHEVDYAVAMLGDVRRLAAADDGDTATIAINHINHNRSSMSLRLNSDVERRVVYSNKVEWCMNVTDYTYRRQMEYFFGNIGNEIMVNNVYDAEALFCKLEIAAKEGEWNGY